MKQCRVKAAAGGRAGGGVCKLWWCVNGIKDPASCKALSERETKLTNLDVGNNGIGFEAGVHIADYIKDDSDLTHLNLYMNELCDLGAIDIAKALKDNGAIETLDIGGNNILAPGAEALAEAGGFVFRSVHPSVTYKPPPPPPPLPPPPSLQTVIQASHHHRRLNRTC